MNKLLIVAFSSLLLVCTAQADHGKRVNHGGKHGDRLIGELQLSDEQSDHVGGILEEQWKKRKAIMRTAFEQARPQLEALHVETRQRLADVLTEEQLQKYDELGRKRHERKQKRFERR